MKYPIVAFLLSLFFVATCAYVEHSIISHTTPVEYHFFEDEITWSEAQTHCKSIGGDLVRIYDQTTNDLIMAHINASDIGANIDSGFWIGYNDQRVEGTFEWVSGFVCPYENWGPGEPNNNDNLDPSGQDCVQLRKDTAQWDDEYCGEIRDKAFICEVEVC
ncbi:low affinity immunoglobulin epsilon Fc receptor-like isoform X1 [Saccoglossus kowalevskii]|uniref:Low affinity immunoglobulin epsilon Fc receptor-like n=1 Tax=Saccoglossus kowalevskii TaxID=10224 RepID=A0ABM0MK47_SACKO|nr:PREDICTED: low affinity immunoglobulin epsilon Fc receptor-like [Saccoglossus kowalevskii]